MTTATDVEPEQTTAPAPAEAEVDSPPEPEQPTRSSVGLLVGVHLYETSQQRIGDIGAFDVTTDVGRLSDAQLIAISTRAERGHAPRLPASIDPATSPPIVAICHPGGQDAAIALMQQGCVGVIAEGNERALAAFVDPKVYTHTLMDGFLEHQGKSRGGTTRSHRDAVTNLPEVASFEVRLGEFVESGIAPNVVIMQITNIEETLRRTDFNTIDMMRRRLANSYSDSARHFGCEVFALSQSTFAVLDGAQRLLDIEEFARELIAVTEAFRPGGIKLKLAVGAVAATAGSEVMAIREQAEQAVMAASQSEESAFVTAEQVTVLLAGTTEYQVAEALAGLVDRQLPNPDGHSSRVAEFVADMAREMGFQGRELSSLKLAALLHDVGKVSPDSDEPADNAAEDYPERGARYVLASAGPEVADAIRFQAERWDGQGTNGLTEDDIPLGARVIAIADATDTWLHPPDGTASLGPAELVEKISSEAGTMFDPNLTETALKLFGGN